jgi:hypothetical protein
MTDSEVKPPTIMGLSLKWGLLSAGISVLLFVVRAVTSTNPFDNKAWGWTVLTLAMAVAIVVLTHREFKNNGDGYMSFGQGFKLGFLSSVISIIIYGIFVMIYTGLIDTEVMNNMYQAQREEMESNNMSDEQIDMAIGFTEKLFWPIFFVFGLIFSCILVLIVTIFTQKKSPEQI